MTTLFRRIVLLSILFAPGLATAGEISNDAEKPVGVVQTEAVNVRAGPSENYEVLCQLDTGDEVRVLSQLGDWVEVQLAFSPDGFIHTSLITAVEPGVGRPTGRNVNVRARPDLHSSVLAQLDESVLLELRGNEADFVRIGLPRGCSLWIHSDYLHIESASQHIPTLMFNYGVSLDPPVQGLPADEPAQTPIAPGDEAAQSRTLRRLSERFRVELERPFEQMELDELVSAVDSILANSANELIRAEANALRRRLAIAVDIRDDYIEKARALDALVE